MANYPKKQYSNNNNMSNNSNQTFVKKSGCKFGTSAKNGKDFIQAWKVTKGEATIKMIACPSLSKSIFGPSTDIETAVTKQGQEYEKWICSLTQGIAKPVTYTGFFNRASGKLRIPDLNMVASTRAPNGGYFGKSIAKTYKK